MKRENEPIPWRQMAIVEWAIANQADYLFVTIFKERPEMLRDEFLADRRHWKRLQKEGLLETPEAKGVGRLYHFLIRRPLVAFRVLQHAFPDVVNRLWIARWRRIFKEMSDDDALELTNDCMTEPYAEMHRDWIAPSKLAELADDEQEARKMATNFASQYAGMLPHAQYCFLSSAYLAGVAWHLGTEARVVKLLEYVDRLDLSIDQWISPQMVATALEEHAVEDNFIIDTTIESEGPLSDEVFAGEGPWSLDHYLMPKVEWNDEEKKVKLIYSGGLAPDDQVRRAAIQFHALRVRPDWVQPTATGLYARAQSILEEGKLPKWERKDLSYIVGAIDKIKEKVGGDDPLLHDYLRESGAADELYRSMFANKEHWWSILFVKVNLVTYSDSKVFVVFPREGEQRSPNGHRIFQCRCCGQETHRVDAETGAFFCSLKCMNAK